MKYKALLYSFFSCLFLTGHSQSWFTSYAPHNRDVSASAIPSRNGIVLGAGFEVAEDFEDYFLSTDYGFGWSVLSVDTPTSQVRSMAFKDSLSGYGVCLHGKIVKTTDGGNSWVKVDTIADRRFFKVIYFSSQTLYIAGGSLLADSSVILKSTDGGDNWTEIYAQPGHHLRSIAFTDSLNGFAVGDSSEILQTVNGGSTWTPVSPPVTGRNFTGIVFPNSGIGYIIGGIRDSIRTILATTNGGQNWAVLADEPGGGLNDITFINANEGYIAGDSATVLKTTDGGQNWTPQVLPNTLPFQRINTVSFYDSNLGIIGGMGGYVRIYTNASPPVAATSSWTPIDASTVILRGQVNTHGIPALCYFNVSTDSTFATTAFWSGGATSDSLVYFSMTVGGLTPATTYYYYFGVIDIAGNASGDTLSFYFYNLNYSVQTLQATNIASNSASLNGSVDKMPFATSFYFDYGLTSSLGDSVPANPQVVNDTLFHTVGANVASLLSDTTYYFRLKGKSGNIVYQGAEFFFHTSLPPAHFQTLDATGITANKATLNGMVNMMTGSTSMSFEYGTTQAFGTQAAATPVVITDTLQHFVTANLQGLQTGTVYYFRLKGVNGGSTFYGNTMQFYTGTPIPNWDFELWQTKRQYFPDYWTAFGNMSLGSSYHPGGSAYLFGDPKLPLGLLVMGSLNPAGGPPVGGTPFTARPDSLIFYANYNIAAGDSAVAAVLLTRNGVTVAGCQNFMAGNTGGNFVRKAFHIDSIAPGAPDTMMVIFSNSNVFTGQFNPASWLKVDDISFSGTNQNVPNANLDSWDSVVYEMPESWATTSEEAPANLFSTMPVTKTTDAWSGHYAAHLQSVSVPALSSVTSGSMATVQGNSPSNPGFAIGYPCVALNGYFKFTPVSNDTMSIEIRVFKNGNQIGAGRMELDTLVANYTRFTIPINYNNTGLIPDSGTIYIRNCVYQPHAGSVLIVDDLGLDGFYADVDEVIFTPSSFNSDLKLYPNPSGSTVFIKPTGLKQHCFLEIFDLTGALKYSEETGSQSFQVDVSTLPPGVYLVKAADDEKSAIGKMTIVR